MSRPALRGRVAAWVNAGGWAGSVVKSLIRGAPALRSARARNTTPTPTATAPPRPRPRARAAWPALTAPTTGPPIPPSAKSPKPTIPGTSRSPASAGPTTKSAPAITPKTLHQPPRGLASSIASSSVDALLLSGPLLLAQDVLLDLPGRGLRERAEGHRLRAFEVRQRRPASTTRSSPAIRLATPCRARRRARVSGSCALHSGCQSHTVCGPYVSVRP